MSDTKDANTLTLHVVIPKDATNDIVDTLRKEALRNIRVQAASAVMRPMHVECQIVKEREVNPGEWRTEDDDSAIRELPARDVLRFVVPCEHSDVVAVLADSPQEAMEYAVQRWPEKNVRVIAISDRTSLGRLYGHQGVPLVMAPGTQRLLWHRDVAYHERCGRVVPLPD